MTIKVFKYFLLFFIVSLSTFSQERNTLKIPLKDILTTISNQHEVGFSYIDEDISVFKLIPPNSKLSLKQKLTYLRKNTSLFINILDEKHITISSKKTLYGYVFDKETNKPLGNVTFKNPNEALPIISQENGYFEFTKSISSAIVISCIGYATKTITIKNILQQNFTNIYLDPVIETLSEVVVSNYLTTGISKKLSGLYEVKPKKFGILPGLIEPDILQTIQQIPGINSPDETISNISVRGGTHDQNLFLWNGIRMFQTGHFFGLISAFNPSLAHTIKIYKNGSSAFYGESVSSVIDISTHPKEVESSNTNIGGNLISTDFYSKIKTSSTSSIEISGRRSFTDLISSPTYKKYYNRVFQNTIVTNLNSNNIINYKSSEDFYFYDFTTQFQKKIGHKNELIIDLIGINNQLAFTQNSIASQTPISKNSNLSQLNFGGSLHWKTNWNEKNSTQFNFYGTTYKLNSTNQAIESNQTLDQQNGVFDMGFRVENQYKLNAVFSFNNGYQYNKIVVSNIDQTNFPSFYRKSKEVQENHALILETQYNSINNATFLKSGIRINYLEKFNKFIVEPRIQLNHKLSNTLNLEILAELKSQTSSQIIDLQQDFLGLEKRRWTLTNDGTIPIQKSQQLSLGFTYKNKKWLITLDNYYKRVTGITSSDQGFQNQLEFTNIYGEYTICGTEFLIQKNFNHFHTWLSYTFNDNNYSFKEYQPNVFPNNVDIAHTFSWAGSYEWNNLKIALGSKWHSGKPTTIPLNNNLVSDYPYSPKINYNNPNSGRLNDYFQLNFSASQNWDLNSKTKLSIGVSILNILNKKNILNRYYRVNTTNNSIESIDTYSLERTPNLSIKLSI
ncbi:CarboxypepD_reg-like domain-containing protein [Flavobacterium gillisiae]|uniref:CarboxypepD_reg-like domain-containing protein n=1 Tax=Flavobacterium gillisiae TaxID=150146 RepID=A0A1H4EYZ2_9FLAO|nr:carboxypeptidase-like regulatory domain-containing protein [Flavobacterium gillisiae]SEA90243.1 CarboxypepD_reg-like domain-containing protein [Flavobacterium gillisiae]